MADSFGDDDVVKRFRNISKKSYNLTDEDYLCAWKEEKDPDIAKLREMAYNLHTFKGKNKKMARSMIESVGCHRNIRVAFTTQKCKGFFMCHVFIHGIHIDSSEGMKMKVSRQNAFENALTKLLMPYLRIRATDTHAKSLDASLTPFSSSPPREAEFPSGTGGVGTVGLEESLNKESNRQDLPARKEGSLFKPIEEFVVLEPKNPVSDKNVDATMRRSANMSEMLLEYEYLFNADRVQCILRLENRILADVMGSSKSNARTVAAAEALQKLQEFCWTIKTKATGPISDTISDTNIVTRDQLLHGMSPEEGSKTFSQVVRKIVEDYASSKIEESLAFVSDFKPKEQKVIRGVIKNVGLRSDTVRKRGIKYFCVWRPYSMLFAFLKFVGGETKRYRLIPPKQTCKPVATAISGGSHLLPGASNFDVNIQPGQHEHIYNQQGQVPGGMSSEGSWSKATSNFQTDFAQAEDWTLTTSDFWEAPVTSEAWTSQDPSSSSQQEPEFEHPDVSEHPVLPLGYESSDCTTADGKKFFSKTEEMPLESLRKIFLLENVHVKTDRQLLMDTANFNKLFIKFRYHKPNSVTPLDSANQVVCHVLLSNKIVASGASSGKASALASACHEAAEKMRKNCWCIKLKQSRDDTDIVSRSEFCGGNPKYDSSSTLSPMQSKGWPTKGEKPGSSMEGRVFDQNKIKIFLETLLRSCNTHGLIFRDEFSDSEVKCIQNHCKRAQLFFNVFHKKTGTFYHLSRKWTASALFKHLQALGGESDDHKLVPPLGENGDTYLDSKPAVDRPMTVSKGSLAEEIHCDTLTSSDHASSTQEHDNNAIKNSAQGLMLWKGHGHNPKRFEDKSYLRGFSRGNPRYSGQASKDHGKSEPRNRSQDNQNPNRGERNSYKPRNAYDTYYHAPGHASHDNRGPSKGERNTCKTRIAYDKYYYASGQAERHSYNPRETYDNYHSSNLEEDHAIRHRSFDTDYHGSSQGVSDFDQAGYTDDYYSCSSQRESHSHRRRDTEDDFHGSGLRESYGHRQRNADDDYYDSGGRGREGYRYRSYGDGPNWDADNIDRYNPGRDTQRTSHFLEKRRYEAPPVWREDNCSPHKMIRGWQSEEFDGYRY